MTEEDRRQSEQAATCTCITAPAKFLENEKELGMDENFASVTLLICPLCGQHWLRYFYEVEAFTASGRWYLGAVQPEQASLLTAEKAKATLEGLSWYFYGGSYYGGWRGKASGMIFLNP
jgi:hypothetical protein